jgi:UPF0755 protein
MRWLLRIAIGLISFAVLAGGGAFLSLQRYIGPGPLETTRAIQVPRGGPEQVGETLAQQGVIEASWMFRVAAIVTSGKGPLRAGEFTFPEHASLQAVLIILRAGRPVQHRLTIPEGLTAAQIALLLDRADALDGETTVPDEGEMLPQTYAYTYGTLRSTMVERARAAMDRTLAQAWMTRAPNLPLTSPHDMLVLASIVERETARPEERPHVAAVFLNRLRLGMRLQSDPTVAYAASGGLSSSDRGLTRTDLALPNPYNTYTNTGLPPGPIASPGLASIEAAAQPLRTDDLYFVADGTGGHAFASNLEDHNRNVAKWRAKSSAP